MLAPERREELWMRSVFIWIFVRGAPPFFEIGVDKTRIANHSHAGLRDQRWSSEIPKWLKSERDSPQKRKIQ